MKNIYRTVGVLIIVFLVSSCNSVRGDGGFLSEKPCGPPCFYGITPGVTTKSEAEEILKQNSFSCTFFDYTPGGKQGYMCSWGDVGLDDKGNIVTGVTFRTSSKITLQKVIDKYGEPDVVGTGIVSLPDDKVRVGMILGFKTIRTWIWLEEQHAPKYTVREDSVVHDITYSADFDPQPGNVPWKGYGEYDWTFTLP